MEVSEYLVTGLISAVSAYVGLKVLVTELRIKVSSLQKDITALEGKLTDVQTNAKDIAVLQSQQRGVYKGLDKLSDKIDEIKK